MKSAKKKLLHNTEELILICTRKDLNDELKNKAIDLIKEGIDWESFCKYAIRVGFTVLISETLWKISNYAHVPEYIIGRLRIVSINILAKVESDYKYEMEILRLFSENKVPVVPLKGLSLAEELYGDRIARGLSVDLDLLIKEDEKIKAFNLLEGIGYERMREMEAERWECQYVFTKPGAMMIDLHCDITITVRSRERIEGLWAGAEAVCKDEITYYAFKNEELLLYLSAHLVNSSVFRSLKHICDIDQLLCRHGSCLDWGELVRKAREWRLANSLYAALAVSKKLFASSMPNDTLKKIKPPWPKRSFIRYFANRKFILQDCKRKKIMNSCLGYVFFELVEAKTFSEYFGIIFRRILFPPRDVLLSNKNYSSKPVYLGYALRLFRGLLRVLDSFFLDSYVI